MCFDFYQAPRVTNLETGSRTGATRGQGRRAGNYCLMSRKLIWGTMKKLGTWIAVIATALGMFVFLVGSESRVWNLLC